MNCNLIFLKSKVYLHLILFGILFSNQPLHAQMNCCCGSPKEIIYPGLDFEFDNPPYNDYYSYYPGAFGPWSVTSGIIDHGDAAYCGGLSNGNPNGPSSFVDLYGTPKTGGAAAGTIVYLLTGLKPGSTYFIEFWYATYIASGSFSANLKVANGAWLNVNWTANNPGSVIWLKKTYSFVALASSASMSFTDTSPSAPTVYIGMLLDDIRIFECPEDIEKPIVLNPPTDVDVDCTKHIPPVPKLEISDNCDLNSTIKFKERKDSISPCLVNIYRNWEVQDHCGNIAIVDQLIHLQDIDAPVFITKPTNKTVYCHENVMDQFNLWVSSNADAQAIDNCGKINWISNFDRLPESSCDSLKALFSAIDNCGNVALDSAYFIVKDSSRLRFIQQAQSKIIKCNSSSKDSLHKWLLNNGESIIGNSCSALRWKNTFDGDSTKSLIQVKFVVMDSCGNKDSTMAEFIQLNQSDTTRIKNFQCNLNQGSSDTLYFNAKFCDSIVIQENIPIKKDSIYQIINTCSTIQKTQDTLHLFNKFGCDSTIFLTFQPKQINRTILIEADCTIQTYSIDSVILKGAFCDSIVVVEKRLLRKDSILIQNTSCDSTMAGIFKYKNTNSEGCDSVTIVQTKYSSTKITFINKSECNLQNSYIDTLSFSNNPCDSLVITNHVAFKSDTNRILNFTCKKEDAGIFIEKYINQFGCDSIIIKSVETHPSDSVIIFENTCDISKIDTERFVLMNRFGCDSLVTKFVQFYPSDTTILFQTSCDPLQVGNDTLVYRTNRCDSLVILHTDLKITDTTMIHHLTCDTSKAKIDTSNYIASNGCDSLVLTFTDYVPLKVELQVDSISCSGKNDGQISIANIQSINAPVRVFFDQMEVFNFPLNNIPPGKHELFIIDSAQCVSKIYKIELLDPNLFVVDLGGDIHLQNGMDTLVTLNSNHPIREIEWIPIGCQDCRTIRFKADYDFWLIGIATDQNGCHAIDSIYIRVDHQDEIYLPNVFSPNGDNINDVLFAQGSSNIKILKMNIFDRWGEKVFDCSNCIINESLSGWNGNYHNSPINPGVFIVYISYLDSSGREKEFFQSITLIR